MRSSILSSLLSTVALVSLTTLASAQRSDSARVRCKEGSACDKREDVRDRRENVRDRRENVRDRKENARERRREKKQLPAT